MTNQNFTDFTLKTPASGDFLVGYNADGSAEYKTTVNTLVGSFATNTALNAASSVLLPTSIYRSTSGTFIQSNTTLIPTATAVNNIVMMTQANYDALVVKQPNTIYFIIDSGVHFYVLAD
jgi:hypothetical protein